MQVLNVAGFEKMVLYNACKAYVNQIRIGEEYTELCEVVAITITDFIMFEELDGVQNRFRMRAQENPEIYHSDLELIFIELPKFSKGEEELSSTYEKWLYFLKKAKDLTAIPAKLSDELAIVQAFEIANKAGLTEEELEDQERREIFIQDQRGLQQLAEQRGEKRGEEKGRLEGRLEVARRLLQMGMNRDEVAQLAGVDLKDLPEREVR